MNYINISKKRLVGRNNQICSSPIVMDYSTVEEISFQFINDQNQIQHIEGLSGLYFAGSLGIGQQSYDLLFLSKEYTIVGDVLTFKVDTYTRNYLDKIKKKNTEINIEIGQIAVETKRVLLRDFALAYPRVYVAGLTPQEIESNDYYTKEEVNELIGSIELSGYATEEYVNNAVATKQDLITDEDKLDYGLISGTPSIPTKVSELENDSGFQTASDVQDAISGKADIADIPLSTSQLDNDSGFITEDALSGKQDKITDDSKLAYSLISGTPSIPTKVSELDNDSGFITDAALTDYQLKITNDSKLAYSLISGTPSIPTKVSELDNDTGFQTASDVQNAISGKADTSALTAHTSDATIHVTAEDKTNWNGKIDASALEGYATELYVDGAVSGKQDLITDDSKLAYGLVSGTPSIPTKVSDLQNDTGFITEDALSGKQDKITDDSKLAYSLISGTPSIPTKTSDLTNDSEFATSGYVQQETSGKLDAPSGGTVGQVIKKTADGAEWADDFELNPTLVQIEEKSLGQDTAYTVDFTGKQIQKYTTDSAASGSIEIVFDNIENIPSGCAPTVELQIPAIGEVTTISLPSGAEVIDIPDMLEGGGPTGRRDYIYSYHDIVFRSEKDGRDEWKTYVNYAYKFSENVPGEDTRDYFYVEALEDGALVKAYNYDAAYNLSASVGDKYHWTIVTGATVAEGLPAGTKVYLIGDTTTLSSSAWGKKGLYVGCNNKNYAIGGKLYSLFDSMLEEKTLTNPDDVAWKYQNETRLVECSVDFSPVLNTRNFFSQCYSLIGLPDGFSCQSTTNAMAMFSQCSSLIGLPDGFSCPSLTAAQYMFFNCTALTGIPNGFDCPSILSSQYMFNNCTSLTTIGDNVKIANGASASNTDNTSINKSLITSIGVNFEWFTNATFSGTWDPALGPNNVFENAVVGSGWKIYDHYDGE